MEEYIQIERGVDISNIDGLIPQDVGEGYQFEYKGRTYTTVGYYSSDGKRRAEIVISSFVGLCVEAEHYYAKLNIPVINESDYGSISGYMGGIEIPNDYQSIEGEFVRPLTKEEVEEGNRWDTYEAGELVGAFTDKEKLESLISLFCKKFSHNKWHIEIRHDY